MSFLRSLNIGASGLTAQKFRMDIISQNIANADTTRTENGSPYCRKMVVFEAKDQRPSFSQILENGLDSVGGVRVSRLEQDPRAFKLVYAPGHPDADQSGYVQLPNVDMAKEMIDMMAATRSYEANVTVINAVKMMAGRALEIGK